MEAILKKGGASSPATSGPKTLANPKPTRVGSGGMCPSDLTPWPPSLAGKGENLAGFSASEKDKTLANPKPTRVGKWVVQGDVVPMAGDRGGCPPHKFQKRGEQLTPATKQRVGPRTLTNPQPTGVGNGGGGGAAPSQGVWGMCPQNKKEGASSPH